MSFTQNRVLSRVEGQCSVLLGSYLCPSVCGHYLISGCILKAISFIADYIIVITARERKGSLLGQDIYKATDFDILPIGSQASVSAPSHPVEAHLLGLVKSHLKSGYFLFSYTWDITRKMQAQWERHGQDGSKPMWEKVG
jgi:hypothetical protein